MGNAGYRQIHPEIWGDPWFVELTSDEKLLFIYMFSNERTSLSGLYEISKRQISFDTKLSNSMVSATLEKFHNDKKIISDNNIYFVVNQFKRHFSRSPKVITRVRKDIDSIRECVPKEACKCLYAKLIGHPYNTDIVSIDYPYNTDTETHKIRKDKIRKDEEKIKKDNLSSPPDEPLNSFLEDLNEAQLIAIKILIDDHGPEKVIACIKWAQKKGMTTGETIIAAEKAVPYWIEELPPKISGGSPEQRIAYYMKKAQENEDEHPPNL